MSVWRCRLCDQCLPWQGVFLVDHASSSRLCQCSLLRHLIGETAITRNLLVLFDCDIRYLLVDICLCLTFACDICLIACGVSWKYSQICLRHLRPVLVPACSLLLPLQCIWAPVSGLARTDTMLPLADLRVLPVLNPIRMPSDSPLRRNAANPAETFVTLHVVGRARDIIVILSPSLSYRPNTLWTLRLTQLPNHLLHEKLVHHNFVSCYRNNFYYKNGASVYLVWFGFYQTGFKEASHLRSQLNCSSQMNAWNIGDCPVKRFVWNHYLLTVQACMSNELYMQLVHDLVYGMSYCHHLLWVCSAIHYQHQL